MYSKIEMGLAQHRLAIAIVLFIVPLVGMAVASRSPISSIFLLTISVFVLLAFSFIFASRSFLPIFGLVVIIGYLQGSAELFFNLPVDFGVIKYGLLFSGFAWWGIRMTNLRRFANFSQLFRYVPLLLWILFYGLFLWTLARSIAGGVEFGDIYYGVSLWSVLNIPLLLVFFFETKSFDTIYSFLGVLIRLGWLAAVVGIVQFLLGPNRMFALGIDIYKIDFSFINAAGDALGVFRVFSLFPTHYEFASFMATCLVAQFTLQIRSGSRINLVSGLSYCILFMGLAVTYNVTIWLLTLGIFLIMILGLSTIKKGGVISSQAARVARQLVLIVIVGFPLGMLIPSIRFRVLGLFEISGTSYTAGGSLFWRLKIIQNTLELIREFPLWGLGFSIRSLLVEMQIARGWFLVTSDSFFLWLPLMGGVPLFLCFLLFLVLPLRAAYKYRDKIPKTERPLFWAIWSFLCVGVVFGGLSNSAILNGTPTNLLVWAGVGVLLKIVETARSSSLLPKSQ